MVYLNHGLKQQWEDEEEQEGQGLEKQQHEKVKEIEVANIDSKTYLQRKGEKKRMVNGLKNNSMRWW